MEKKLFKSNRVQAVVNALLIFLLSICIVVSALTAIVRFTVLNPSFVTDALNDSEFYRYLSSDIREDLVSIGDASGFDRAFFDSVVDDVLIRDDIQSYVDKFFSKETLKVDTAPFENKLRQAIKDYVISSGIKTGNIDDKKIEHFIQTAKGIYAKGLAISYFPTIKKWVQKQVPRVTIALIISTVLALGIIVFMILTQRWKHKAVRRMYYSFTAAGLFLLAIPATVFASGIIGKITIFPTSSAREMYTLLMTTFFNDVLTIAVTVLVIAGALCVASLRMRKKAKA